MTSTMFRDRTAMKIAEAVTLLRSERMTVGQLCAAVEAHPHTITKWLRAFQKGGHVRPAGFAAVKAGTGLSFPMLWEWVEVDAAQVPTHLSTKQ
jgi:transposase-like protein